MMQMIKYEIKKYVVTKNNLIFFLVITLAGSGILLWNEWQYVADRNIRQSFYAHMEQRNVSVADKQKIITERETFRQELFDKSSGEIKKKEMKKRGKYAKTKWDDYELLGEVLNCIDVVEKRNRNMALVADIMQKETGDYQKENNQMLADQGKLTVFVQNMFFGIILCLLLLFVLCSSFAVEQECHMEPVLYITKSGGGRIAVSKILTGVLLAFVLNIFYWGLYCVLQFLFVGMTGKDFGKPLFLVKGCQMCASGMTIQTVFVKQMLASLIISVLTVLFTMTLSKVMKKSISALMASLAVFIMGLLPDLLNAVIYNNIYVAEMSDWYFLSIPEFSRMLRIEKIINPISLLQFQYYAAQPRYIQISGYQYPAEIFPVLGTVLLAGMFGRILSGEKGR